MNITPSISVVIPTHNRPVFLKEAMESVLAQTITDWEMIIVDDQSGPETKQMVESFCDPRIKYCRTPKQKFAGGSRNLGVAQVQSPLISFLDDDDYYKSEKLELTLSAFSAHPDAGVVAAPLDCGDFVFSHNLNGKVFSKITSRFHFLPTSTLAFRRDIFDKLGGFDPDLVNGEDFDLCLRAARITEFLTLGSPLVFYRQHAATRLTFADSERSAICFKSIVAKNFTDPEKGISKRGNKLFNNFRAYSLLNTARSAYWTGNRSEAIRSSFAALRLEPGNLKLLLYAMAYCLVPRAVASARQSMRKTRPIVRQ